MSDNKKKLLQKALLMILCILLNICGNKVAKLLQLPFWLDTIGTGITACLYGPWIGALTGLATNLLLGISDILSVYYCFINVGIGVIIGMFAKKGMCSNVFSILCVSVVTGMFTVICAVPVNCLMFEGRTSNLWGDALFDMLGRVNLPIPLRSTLAQLFLDIPDKVISMLCVYGTLKLIEKKSPFGKEKSSK